jgi:hypothetical protein
MLGPPSYHPLGSVAGRTAFARRCSQFYLSVQVAEVSYFKYKPVTEAHVRAYAVLHETHDPHAATGTVARPGEPEQALFQTRSVRLTSPNDELGGMLFLATPQVT